MSKVVVLGQNAVSFATTHRLGTAEVTRGLGVTRLVASRGLRRDSEVSYARHTGDLRSIPLSIRIRGMELGFLVRFGIVETTYTVGEFFFWKCCTFYKGVRPERH